MNPNIFSSPRLATKTAWQLARILAILPLFALEACAPSPAAPAETITEAPAVSPPTDTATPLPTATATLAPTATPEPTATKTPTPTATQPAQRQGLIAFVMAQGGGGIYVIQADGSGDPVVRSWHPYIDSRPSWSPDGSMIAFESERDDPAGGEHLDIFTMNADGSGLSRVTDTDAWYAQPDWSADGSRIVVSFAESQDAGDADLGVLDLKTRELTRLTEGPAIEMEPSWSADGTQIAFASYRDGSLNIYTINLDTGEETQLTQASGDNNHPDWSKDGKKMLFVSTRDGDEEIYVMDADGGNQARLTTTPGRDVDPEWSPDGNFFAFSHEESGLRKIYVSDLKGSSPELLFEMPEQTTAGHPAWSTAEVTLSDEPVIGSPFCARDTDGDGEPDTASTTFSTEDDMGFILFPYDNMQDGMDLWYTLTTPGTISFTGENHPGWDGGESGIHTTFFALQHAPGVVPVKFYLGDKLMQEIECEVVEP